MPGAPILTPGRDAWRSNPVWRFNGGLALQPHVPGTRAEIVGPAARRVHGRRNPRPTTWGRSGAKGWRDAVESLERRLGGLRVLTTNSQRGLLPNGRLDALDARLQIRQIAFELADPRVDFCIRQLDH